MPHFSRLSPIHCLILILAAGVGNDQSSMSPYCLAMSTVQISLQLPLQSPQQLLSCIGAVHVQLWIPLDLSSSYWSCQYANWCFETLFETSEVGQFECTQAAYWPSDLTLNFQMILVRYRYAHNYLVSDLVLPRQEPSLQCSIQSKYPWLANVCLTRMSAFDAPYIGPKAYEFLVPAQELEDFGILWLVHLNGKVINPMPSVLPKWHFWFPGFFKGVAWYFRGVPRGFKWFHSLSGEFQRNFREVLEAFERVWWD